MQHGCRSASDILCTCSECLRQLRWMSESLELTTAQILCAQNAAWLQKCMKYFVYSTGSEYLRQLRKVSVSFELLMSLLNLNYCCLSAYQPSRLTAIPNHLMSFGESWNPQTNTILTAETAQSTELVKRTCQACVQWKCTHPLTTEFCWYLTTVARIIPGAFLSSYIMRLWTVAETKGWLPAKAAAQSVPTMDDTHMFSLPFDCSKVWVNWQLWEMKQTVQVCVGAMWPYVFPTLPLLLGLTEWKQQTSISLWIWAWLNDCLLC